MDFEKLNKETIKEFRANGGCVGGPFEGQTLLLLHHIGAKSGTERVSPLVYRVEGDASGLVLQPARPPDSDGRAWY